MPEQFDLAVIGGGISGVGVALEAARLKIKVALIDKQQCLSATSNNSLRIIHSGFRYLQNLSLERVLESTSAQAELLELAGNYLSVLPCLMPLKKWGLKSKYPLWLAGKSYALFRHAMTGKAWHCSVLSKDQLISRVPFLKDSFPHGALLWEDVLIRDQSGLHEFLKNLLLQRHVQLFENCPVNKLEHIQNRWLADLSGKQGATQLSCKTVINCAGPAAAQLSPFPQSASSKVAWCRAFNLVVLKQFDAQYAFALHSNSGRLFFIVPREKHSVIGTYYIKASPDRLERPLDKVEVLEFLNEFNQCLPGPALKAEDVVSYDLGILPCAASNSANPELLDTPRIFMRSNYAELISIKYTTFLSQARKVLKTLTF